MSRSENYTSNDPTLNPPIVEGQENPMLRDTILIPQQHSATLRFVANNPGAWLFHCESSSIYRNKPHKPIHPSGHIEWHFEIGFAVQFIEAPLEAQKNSGAFPSILNEHCAKLGLPFSGNAAGHMSTTDLSGLTVGPDPQTPVINSPCAPVYNRTHCQN